MARGRGNAKKRVADMSPPPEQRRRKRKGKGRGTKGVIAQMDHASNPEAAKRRRAYGRCESRVREDGDPVRLTNAAGRDEPAPDRGG